MAALQGIRAVALIGALAGAVPARAEVTAQGQLGFVSRNVVVVPGTPAAVWKRLVTPSGWWSSEHTFSGDAANLSLDPVAGGCFCEKLPAEDALPAKPGKPAPRPGLRGGVEHMHVVFVDHAKALRLVGALGPLQSEAVTATLTVTLKSVEGGTRVIFEYVVGGYMRYPADKIAPSVDTVMGNQLASLAKLFGPVAQDGAKPAPAAPVEPAAPQPVSGGRGLDRKGLLVPRGKVWSLPANGPALPPPAPPAPTIAPLPNEPVPQDVSVQATVDPVAAHAKAPAQPAVDAGSAAAPASAPAPAKPKAKAKTKPPVKTPAPKPAPKATATGDEPSRDSIDSAFDAAFSGAPRPVKPPQ